MEDLNNAREAGLIATAALYKRIVCVRCCGPMSAHGMDRKGRQRRKCKRCGKEAMLGSGRGLRQTTIIKQTDVLGILERGASLRQAAREFNVALQTVIKIRNLY